MTAYLGLPAWVPQWNHTGSLDYARVSASTLGANPARVCVEHIAHKARPEVRFAEFVDRTYPPLGDFWLGIARDALLLLLEPVTGAIRATTPEQAVDLAVREDTKREWLDASKVVIATAIRGYLNALNAMRAGDAAWADARFAPALVLVGENGTARTEWSCWGLYVIRDGGRVRETHLLRHRRAGTRPLPPARLAAAAHIAGDGFLPDPNIAFWDPYEPAHVQPPACERVVVREVGVLDGTQHIVFDNTPTVARAEFAATVPHVLDLYRGGVFHSGPSCSSCTDRPYCPGVRRVRGALGVVPRSPFTLPVGPTDLSDQMACARRVHLRRDLGLPVVPTESNHAAQRGIRVHQWLEVAHQRGHVCTVDDLPEGDLPTLAVDLGWTGPDYQEARPLLVGHLDWCFVQDARDVEVEHEVSLWDPECNVVFSTRLDATFIRPGTGRVLRETKTISFRRLTDAANEYDLIEMFPQVAFALSMLAIGWDPVAQTPLDTTEGPGLVELELLWAGDGTVVAFDPSNRDHGMAARRFLADAVDRRLTDTVHAPQPGRQCQWCSMRDWCDARTEDATWTPPTGELLADATPAERRTLVGLLAEPAAPSDDNDEFPF